MRIFRHWWSVALLAVFMGSLPTSRLLAQTGSVDPTTAQLAAVPKFTPPRIELIEEPRVDLRRWLPPVGEQQMNDCTTWAIAYAAKSYLEARDQGWLPDRPERVFSPRFLYNQINHGQDEGSSFVEAVRVLCEQGASTLATEPYRPGDFRTAPNERARAEAKAFPLRDAHLVVDRQGIRRALQRRQIVVFGAHVNPIFLSGRFPKYDRALFDRDEQLRQPGQPHGKHAMCIVGYDDGEGTFLVMNSWGTKWARRGFCQVAYELFDDIRLAGEHEGVFCNWAITLLDVEEKVVRNDDGSVVPAPATLEALAIRGHADAVRFDANAQKFTYTFFADLRGPRTLLADVKAVDWFWSDETGKPRRVRAEEAANGFALVAGTQKNPTPLVAVLQLADGATHRVEGQVEGPVPVADFRPAQIHFRDQYSGRLADGKTPVWYFEAGLDVPAGDVADIVAVKWTKPAMDRLEPVSEYKEGGEGARSTPAYSSALGWSNVAGPIDCEITYRDGGRKRLHLEPQFTDVVRDEPCIEWQARAMSKDASGRTVQAVTVSLDMPHARTFEVDHVEWELDPWLSGGNRIVRQSTFGWPLRCTAVRDFRATATIVWMDGRRTPVERWIELGATTRFSGEERLDVEAFDRFVGLVDGVPTWDVAWRLLGDRQALAKVAAVTWRTTSAEGLEPVDVAGGEVAQRFVGWTRTRGPQRGTAVITYDGRTIERSLEHMPIAPASSALRIEQVAFTPDPKLGETHPDRDRSGPRLRLHLGGPADVRNRVVATDWVTILDGRFERTRLVGDHLFWPDSMWLDTSADERYRLGVSVTSNDGFVEHLETDVVPGRSVAPVVPLLVRAREKFDGFDPLLQRPRWRVTLQLAGLVDTIARQQKVLYTVVEEGTGVVVGKWEATAGELVTLVCARPSFVSAVVTAADGSTSTLQTRVRCEAPPTPPLVARVLRTAGGGPKNGYTLWLDGHESVLAQVGSVTWRCAATGFSARSTVRHWGPYTGFALAYPQDGGFPVEAEVELQGGEQRTLSVDTAHLERPVRLLASQRYWGNGEWEIECELDATLQRAWAIAERSDFQLHRDGDDPLRVRGILLVPHPMARFRVPAGTHRVSAGFFESEPGVELPVQELVVGAEPVADELRLVATRDHALRAPGADTADWLAYVDGPESLLQQVVRVRYAAKDQYDRAVVRRFAEQQRGFACRFPNERLSLRAKVELRSGQVVELAFESPAAK
ncbi:MAG: C1 family peptidase [Planctomycetes bacterium]|nr:C1 family peptidase [Planctomycetota bacterium]